MPALCNISRRPVDEGASIGLQPEAHICKHEHRQLLIATKVGHVCMLYMHVPLRRIVPISGYPTFTPPPLSILPTPDGGEEFVTRDI